MHLAAIQKTAENPADASFRRVAGNEKSRSAQNSNWPAGPSELGRLAQPPLASLTGQKIFEAREESGGKYRILERMTNAKQVEEEKRCASW
jgi:hypothetical protein